MKKIYFNILAVLLLVFTSSHAVGQDRVVYGIVHTLDSIPLIGAEISVKSTKQKVYTDTLGNFAVACNMKDKIKVNATGFYNQNVRITEDTKFIALNLKLRPGEKNIEYAVGYGHISEKDRTTAINALSNKDTEFTRYQDVFQIIQSMGAEVRGNMVIIRGGNKSFQGSSGALIVVDDVIVDYDYVSSLSPVDIKNINIIKDGSSAVYGDRGANGVVLIETKKGDDSR
jgi:TonB-dependent SusC/RagA subfamily outer membrane receptor